MVSKIPNMTRKRINILVLGETGVGKTTFINMLPNYLLNQTLTDTASRDLVVLAPISFIYVDENFHERTIKLGSDSNEASIAGASSTQRPRTYVYDVPSKNAILNVIDTPGMGDTRGPEYDQRNTQVLLRYISELQYLDAVCVFLKPNNSRFSVLFDYCLRMILKQLMINVRNNLVFVFTGSRGSHYTPGETFGPLKTVIENIQQETGSVIPFGKTNTFCIDNEAFRYLAGRKNGVSFNENEIGTYAESYNYSLGIVNRMVDYIASLTPVPMQNVATPNESIRIILRLTKPLISLLTSFEKTLVEIRGYETRLQANTLNLDLLKQNLIKIEHERIIKEHSSYTHDRSHSFDLSINASFPPFIIGGNASYNFTDNENTVKTQDVDFVQKRTFDKDVYDMITNENTAQAVVQTKITELNNLCDEYKKEIATVLGAVATFYVYCDENSMTASDDLFKKALNSAKEEALLDNNSLLAEEFGKMIERYDIKKRGIANVHPEDIRDVTQELFVLKHSGKTFKQIMDVKFNFQTVQLTVN